MNLFVLKLKRRCQDKLQHINFLNHHLHALETTSISGWKTGAEIFRGSKHSYLTAYCLARAEVMARAGGAAAPFSVGDLGVGVVARLGTALRLCAMCALTR
jgi:hypothetical protein